LHVLCVTIVAVDSFVPKPPTFEYAAAAFSLLPTITTTTTTETTHSTSAGAFLFIPRGTVGGSRHQSAGDKKASGDAPVYQFYHGATPREIFRFGAEQLPRQPPTAVTTASAPTHHDTATKPTATNAFSLLPTITTTKETTNSTAASASLFIPRRTAGGSRHQPADDKNASGDAPVYYGATSKEVFRVDAGQLPRQPPTSVTTASALTQHDTATKPTATNAFSLLPTITTTKETTNSTAAGASLFIPRRTAGGSRHQPADHKNASGDAPVYHEATPREVFRVDAGQLPRQPPTAVTTASAPTHHDTATKPTAAAAAFSLLPTITKTTTETTHSTAAGASLFIPRRTAGGSRHQPADHKNASGDAPVYHGATPREVFRVDAGQLPRQPPTAVTTASALTQHDTATKPTATNAFSLLPTITTTKETTNSTAAGASLFIPRRTAGGSRHQPADHKNASGDAPVYYGATPREVFRVDAGQLPRQPPTAVTTASAPTHHDTATKPTAAAAAFSLLPTITKTTTETTHSTAAGASLFIPRRTAGGSRHQPADHKNASGDAPVYHGATPREVFRVDAGQLPRQPPTAVTTASALTQHDTATKPTATNAFSLLPTITTTKETTNSTAAGASLFIPRRTAGGSRHQPADHKNASGDAPVYHGATPREVFRVDAGQLPRQPPTAVTTASALTQHDTATKPTATNAFSLLPTITTTKETTNSTAAGASLFIPRRTAGGSRHQPADHKNASGDAPVYYGATPREVFRVDAGQLPRQPPTAVTTASAPTHHDTATKPTAAAAAFSLLPTITKTTTETTHSTAAGASLFIPRRTAGGSRHQPADHKNASGDAPVYHGATPREVFRVDAGQLPRQPPTAVTTASALTQHDTATKPTATNAFSLLPTITTTKETTNSTAAGASLFIPRRTAGGSRHQPADHKNASGDAPVYYGATPREVFRVDAGQLPRQPPTAVTTASAPTHHDTATKPTAAAAAFSLLPTITKTTTETTHSTAAGASLFIPRRTAGGSRHQPADHKNASGDAPVYHGATPREVFRVDAGQLPRQPPTAVTTASALTQHDTATKPTATNAFSLLPTITTTKETTNSTAAGASLFIPRRTAGGSRHQPADHKNASGDAPVYHGATPREVFRVDAGQLPRQPPTAVTTASALTQHDTATKPTATNAFSLLPTITTTKETTNSTAAGASLFIPRRTAGGSRHQPADHKNASGDAPVYYGATPREVFRVGAEQLPRQPPTAVTTASAPTYHDTATKLTAPAAFSLLPTITTTKETTQSTAAGASLDSKNLGRPLGQHQRYRYLQKTGSYENVIEA
jgi:Tfp pilus assembly protein PilV